MVSFLVPVMLYNCRDPVMSAERVLAVKHTVPAFNMSQAIALCSLTIFYGVKYLWFQVQVFVISQEHLSRDASGG
jgi:hypothetical protein